jgi:hypothetical protein
MAGSEAQPAAVSAPAGIAKMRVYLLIVALALITGAEEQEQPLGVRVLEAGSIHSLDVPSFSFFGPAQSDNEGNLYFHVNAGSFRKPVVLKLEHSSGDPTLYTLEDEGLKKTTFLNFSVTPSGQVSILSQQVDKKIYLLRFTSKGDLSEKVALDLPEYMSTQSFVAFDTGTVLVSAYYLADAPEHMHGKGLMALFDESGKMLKNLSANTEDVDLANVSQHLAEGAGTVGPDGNMYILQANQIVVISGLGKIMRRIKFHKPEGTIASKIAISQNLVSIWLLREGPKQKMQKQDVTAEYLVLDLLTGKPFSYYVPGKALGQAAIAVAFSGREGFTFFDTQNGHVELISSPLR